MKVKIFTRYQDQWGNWFPYLVINCSNITPEEYKEYHQNSIYKDCKYQIL